MRRTLIVGFLICVIVVSSVGSIIFIRGRNRDNASALIDKFVAELFSDKYDPYIEGDSNIYARYFKEYSEGDFTAQTLEETEVQRNIERAFLYLNGQQCSRWESVQVSSNFKVFYLFDEKDELLPPPVGFWYLVENNEIVEYYVARLLPFSRYDSEYSELWSKTYG